MKNSLQKIQYGDTNLLLIKSIGKGSFGTVYEVMNQSTGEKLAAKQLIVRPNTPMSQIVQNEYRNSQFLKHSSIVRIYDLIRTQDTYYIIMELCDSDLNSKLSTKNQPKKPLTSDEVYNIMFETVTGLRYMQALNVVHRDLKPENILFRQGRIKISDFGVSKKENQVLKTNVGTPLYQAPQVSAGQQYNGKCDVFSLGIILYEMCYNAKPFRTSGWAALLDDVKKLIDTPIQLPSEPVVHPLFKRLIEGCMVHNAEKRMSIGDVYYELVNEHWKSTDKMSITMIEPAMKQIKLKNKLSC